jgi:hypothetical protein
MDIITYGYYNFSPNGDIMYYEINRYLEVCPYEGFCKPPTIIDTLVREIFPNVLWHMKVLRMFSFSNIAGY